MDYITARQDSQDDTVFVLFFLIFFVQLRLAIMTQGSIRKVTALSFSFFQSILSAWSAALLRSTNPS